MLGGVRREEPLNERGMSFHIEWDSRCQYRRDLNSKLQPCGKTTLNNEFQVIHTALVTSDPKNGHLEHTPSVVGSDAFGTR